MKQAHCSFPGPAPPCPDLFSISPPPFPKATQQQPQPACLPTWQSQLPGFSAGTWSSTGHGGHHRACALPQAATLGAWHGVGGGGRGRNSRATGPLPKEIPKYPPVSHQGAWEPHNSGWKTGKVLSLEPLSWVRQPHIG